MEDIKLYGSVLLFYYLDFIGFVMDNVSGLLCSDCVRSSRTRVIFQTLSTYFSSSCPHHTVKK